MSDPTYRDVAEWLPTDIREAIEAGTPCPVNGTHRWWHDRIAIHASERREPVRFMDDWHCACGISRTTDPKAQS